MVRIVPLVIQTPSEPLGLFVFYRFLFWPVWIINETMLTIYETKISIFSVEIFKFATSNDNEKLYEADVSELLNN